MILKDIIDRRAYAVNMTVVIDDHGTWAGTYTNIDDIWMCRYCEVETIDTSADGTLIIIIDGNTGE